MSHIGKKRPNRQSLLTSASTIPMVDEMLAIKGSLRRPTAALDGLSGGEKAEDINQSAKQNQWLNHFA
ncbi:MAG: hypothetical protein SGI99_10350 [Pseudomonadota bacterium]|nr:hypothetical protein [Pseudomonadota bacterium]